MFVTAKILTKWFGCSLLVLLQSLQGSKLKCRDKFIHLVWPDSEGDNSRPRINEVLSNKFGHFGKPLFSRLGKLLANGLANHEGEKWAKHRRILNPAFHHEKIKVIVH
jgi:hypothetical protein